MRIVVKVGTSTLAHKTGRMNIMLVEELCKILSDIKNIGHEVILVSSGAIGMGMGKLNMKNRPSDIPTKQAAASVGQCELMYTYDRLFSQYNHTIAQILITGEDLKNEERHKNFENTINRLLELYTLPIINENDTVAVEEIGIGDNDTLAAIVSVGVKADVLILLSDIDGLFTSDPHKNSDAKKLDIIEEITEEIISLGEGESGKLGTGGMKTKISAAQIVTKEGIDMVIANGSNPLCIYDIVEGKNVGTRFIGKKK